MLHTAIGYRAQAVRTAWRAWGEKQQTHLCVDVVDVVISALGSHALRMRLDVAA